MSRPYHNKGLKKEEMQVLNKKGRPYSYVGKFARDMQSQQEERERKDHENRLQKKRRHKKKVKDDYGVMLFGEKKYKDMKDK